MRISHKILEGHANKAASSNRVCDIPSTNISNDDDYIIVRLMHCC